MIQLKETTVNAFDVSYIQFLNPLHTRLLKKIQTGQYSWFIYSLFFKYNLPFTNNFSIYRNEKLYINTSSLFMITIFYKSISFTDFSVTEKKGQYEISRNIKLRGREGKQTVEAIRELRTAVRQGIV